MRTETTTPANEPEPLRALKYVLITPARNEAAFIEETIKSVVAQTVLPERWIIVSDGSTDGTEEIVRRYLPHHRWMELVQMPERAERHFAGKVHAFNAGQTRVAEIGYDIIGNLDADVSFESDYFEVLLRKFAQDPDLGVAGTPFREGDQSYDYRFTSIEHVSGACQLFTRQCFESIGGYQPLKAGGIDLLAVLTARMKGWKTRTFTDHTLLHHRKMGTGMHRGLKVSFRGGYHDYLMGVNVLWEIFRSVYQMGKRPVVVGGCGLLLGYLWAMAGGAKRLVSDELVAFRKKEEMLRLKNFFTSYFTR